MVEDEESHVIVYLYMPKILASQGGTPASSRTVVSPSHPRMEVGNNLNGFYHQIDLDDPVA